MNKQELIDWLNEYSLEYLNEKELPNEVLFSLKECPFCDGAHKDGAFVIWNNNGYVAAKCHHASCDGASFNKLYELKTGKPYKVDKKKKSQDKESIYDYINTLVNDGLLEVFLDDMGNLTSRIISMDDKVMLTMPVRSFEFRIHIQRMFYEKFGVVLDKKKFEPILDYMGILAYKNNKRLTVYKRVCNLGDKIIYELDRDTNTCVAITKEGIEISDNEKVCFYHSKYYANQVIPDFDSVRNGDWKQLPKLIRKHFNLVDSDNVVLFAIYLVYSFLGTAVNHPILSVSGQKGSGKSSMIKRFCQLVDPKVIGLGDIPKRGDDLSLRISESYVNDFDNLSYLTKDISNLFCKCVTSGVNMRRTLYENSDQTIFNLKSIVVMDGIDVIIKESDLLDRTIFFSLARFEAEQLKTEAELNTEFEKDKSIILALCFSILQLAMQDDNPIDESAKSRMVDFTQWAVRIGRVLGYTDEYIIRILKKNQKVVNQQALEENPLAQVLLCYMEYKDKEVHAVAELLKILKKLAPEIQIDVSKLPKEANVLSRKLNQIRSNLADEGITYDIVPKGRAKIITIWNSKPRRVPINIS